jgi:hypothetical protein
MMPTVFIGLDNGLHCESGWQERVQKKDVLDAIFPLAALVAGSERD